jgi:hypothetical protein
MSVVIVACAMAACSSGDSNSSSLRGDTQAVCTLVERLDRTGEDVAAANVEDPEVFGDTLDSAVEAYTDILDDLHDVVPTDLRDDVERLNAAVEQYRFNDGVEPHAAIDAYASRSCT